MVDSQFQSGEVAPEEELRVAILNALGLSLASKLTDAKAHRAASGVEDEWAGDQDFYTGYDDANRHEFMKTASKPTASGASSDLPVKRRGSTVFPNITQPYVDAAAARVGDMLLPSDDRNFAIEPTPIPEMGAAIRQLQDPNIQFMGQNPMQQPGQPQQDPRQQLKQEAEKRSEKAQERVDDWLSECQYHSEVRKVIDDAARIGSGVLKGPVPVRRKSQMYQDGQLVIVEEIKPASFRVDPWNLFPDPACGESIHNGSYIFERDYLTAKKLKALKGLPGYLDSQIDLCIEEGPKGGESRPDQPNARTTKDQFEIFYWHGEIKAEELRSAGCEVDEDCDTVPAKLTLVNDRVICASMNPLDNGEFPYDVIPWKLRPGMPWGMGIARQMRTAQRFVTAATRYLMDNAGQSAGPQFVVNGGVEPYDGKWEITPLKIWQSTPESDGQSGPPFLSVVIPMLQVELTNIIQLGMKLAEDTTGFAQIMQGQQGTAPDTVGGMQILNANANAVLRRIARLFDSKITEPHIRRYYDWLMAYGEDEEEKGDFLIKARGSGSLVERDIQSQELVNVVQMSLNPAFGKDPKKVFSEFLKSRRFNPTLFDYTDEEKAQMSQQQQPEAPQVQVAKIRAQVEQAKTQAEIVAEKEIAAMENETDQVRIKVDMDRDRQYVMAEHERNMSEHQARMAELQLKLQIEQLKAATSQNITLDELKGKLAMKAADLQTTKELAGMKASADLLPKPPVEPPQKAIPGMSFQQ